MAKNVKNGQKKVPFLESRAFKNFMGKLYGFGASIVIIGALFKIQHYPGAVYLLPIGLGMEAVIFFFSALQKPHVEPDWSMVHPQFLDEFHTEKEIEQMIAEGKITPEYAKQTKPKLPGEGATGSNVDAGLSKMLEEAGINHEQLGKFRNGLEKFTEQAGKMADISQATVATNGYVDSIKNATEAINGMQQHFQNVSEVTASNTEATQAYIENMKSAGSAVSRLVEIYENTATQLENENTAYGNTARKLTENLAALNALYELQLKETSQQGEDAKKMSEQVKTFVEQLDASNQAAEQYKKQVTTLTEKVASLNSVYGNMLSAMNVNSNNK
jgi:gliding motility-associated protein GldL